MNGLIQLSISKKSKYSIVINKDLHDSNGPNAYPIKISHKSNNNVSQLDCCKCRSSANKSSELVNIFANFRITNPNNNQNQTKKNLNKTTKKVKIINGDDVEEEGNAVDKLLVSNNEKKVDEGGSGEKLISSSNESDLTEDDINKEDNNNDDMESLDDLFQKDSLFFDNDDDKRDDHKMDVDKPATKAAGIIEITY